MATRSLVCSRNIKFLRVLCHQNARRFRVTTSSENAVEETVQYPPVEPRLPPGNWSADLSRDRAWELYREGQVLMDLTDVRERLEMIAGPEKRCMYLIQPFDNVSERLAFKQAITRTHIENGLPELYRKSVLLEEEFDTVKSLVVDAILQEQEEQYIDRCSRTDQVLTARQQSYSTSHLLHNILNNAVTFLAPKYNYLLMSQFDKDVPIETFWLCSGFKGKDLPASGKRDGRIMMQYKGKTQFQIRTEQSLPEFISIDDAVCTSNDVPKVEYSPSAAQQILIKERPISVSGHWIGDPCEFNLLSVVIPNHVFYEREQECQRLGQTGQRVVDATIVSAGLMTSFASCAAQAHNLGFNLYFDLTYPLTTQTILTNGQWVQTFAYQLNTLHMWQDAEANPRNNVLWVGDRVRLYDTIENGQVKGLNDDVLRDVIKFLLTSPVDRGINTRPYLSQEDAPLNRKLINFKGEEPLEKPKIGRWQYPRAALYF